MKSLQSQKYKEKMRKMRLLKENLQMEKIIILKTIPVEKTILQMKMERSKINLYSILITLAILMLQQTAVAQSAYKESSNSFARYTQSGDMKNLQEAKKQIDKAYKTKRDSASTRVNIMRALIYSSLAYIDSNRTVG